VLGYLRTAPWRRGPFLLLRRPGVFLALAAACFVATLPAAAAGPFISASRHATLRDEIRQACPSYVGDWITNAPAPPARAESDSAADFRSATARYRNELKRANAAAAGSLGPGVVTQVLFLDTGDDKGLDVVDRPGFQHNVTVLSGPSGSGVWVPDSYAADAHVKVGSTIAYLGATGGSAHVRVAAIYRDLQSEPHRPFWCALTTLWNPQGGFSATPPPMMLADDATIARLTAPGAEFGAVRFLEYSLLMTQPTIDEAKRAVAAIANINAALGVTGLQAVRNAPTVPYSTSDLRDFLPRADLAADVMRPAIAPITAVGIGVGLAVVAAAGVFWVLRRRKELTVLSAHGMSARSLGVKAAIEALPALIIGAAAGWSLAVWLVRTAGPSTIVSSDSLREAAEAAIATFLGAVILVGIVAGLRSRSLADERTHRHLLRLGRLPWELLLIAAAPIVWRRLGGSVVTNGNAGGATSGLVVHVPERLLVVPILAIVGAFVFAGRLWMLALRRRRTGRGRSISRFLAGRRVVRDAAVAAVLATAAAVPVSLAIYGAAVTGSVQTTLTAKTKLFAGSDVVLTLQKPVPIPPVFAGHATIVDRLNGVQVNGFTTDLLGIDPATFTRGAYWNSQITGESLADIIKPLTQTGTLTGPAAIVAGATQTGPTEIDTETGAPVQFDVRSIETLPAQHSSFHTALVNRDLIAKAPAALYQLWIRGDPTTILNQVAATGLRTKYVQTAEDATVNSVYEPLTFTFEYLTALSLLCGVIALVGLLLYLESRSPGHRRAFVMLRRMGMRSGSHWRAVGWELGTPLVIGLVIGLGTSSIAAYALRSNFDVDPSLPPGGLLTLPVAAMIGIAVAVAAVTFAASGYAQFRVVRANPSEILRDAI
jgi:putative ABC transport system permease protein